jgi:hypothetical protein
MNCSDDDSSPPYITSYRNGPYSSSVASSASSSTASIWSDAASQSSDDSSVTGTSDSESAEAFCPYQSTASSFKSSSHLPCEQSNSVATYWPKHKLPAEVAPEQHHQQQQQQRQHPRRTSIGAQARSGPPPSLVRQCDRKVSFVDSLVGKI